MNPVDLSSGHGLAIPAALDAALQTAMGSIPGVTYGTTHASTPPVNPGGPIAARNVRVEAKGWAPTLHEAHLSLVIQVAGGVDEPTFASTLLRRLAPTLERQADRAAAALAHGRSRPLPLRPQMRGGSGIGRIELLETRHLHVDVSLPAVAASAGDLDLASSLRQAIMHMLDGDDEHDGSAIVVAENDVMMEVGPYRCVGTQVVINGEEGRSVTFDGRLLEIAGRMVPDTVLTAAAGRPLRDLATLHPALDGRIVEQARLDMVEDHPVIRMTLVPDWRPWSEIDALASRFA